jgi:dihydrofolate reductase
MRNVVAFEQVTLDGFFADAAGDMGWAHRADPEWDAFVQGNARGGGTLLFGRRTYEQMAAFWPTPLAAQLMPEVAERMNALPKVVFSRTLREASWRNTRLVEGGVAEEVRRLKATPGPDVVVMGSGTVFTQLAEAGLFDRYELVVSPLALGTGRPLFGGLTRPLPLRLTGTRAFGNGNVLLTYAPAP